MNIVTTISFMFGIDETGLHVLKAVYLIFSVLQLDTVYIFEPRHEISNNVVCATSKASDQPAPRRSLIRAFACRLNIL